MYWRATPALFMIRRMSNSVRIALLALLLFLFAGGASQARIFTDRAGRTVDAEIAAVLGGTVSLKLPNGTAIQIPAAQFSDADQAFIAQWTPSSAAAVVAETPAAPAGEPISWSYESKQGSASPIEIANFKLWVPAGPVRGMIALVPGANGDGRGAADDGGWQNFAREMNFGLIACYFKARDTGSTPYSIADDGSGDALLDALKEFDKAHKRPEVASAPLLLWGHSAGGQFNFNFARWKPERTIAFVVNKGGFYYDRKVTPAGRAVPGMLFLGTNDTPVRVANITKLFDDNRGKGALWALCAEPNAGHGVGNSAKVARQFFKSTVALRLPKVGGNNALLAVKEADGWLADNKTFEGFPAKSFKGKQSDASWMPDEATYLVWKEAVQ